MTNKIKYKDDTNRNIVTYDNSTKTTYAFTFTTDNMPMMAKKDGGNWEPTIAHAEKFFKLPHLGDEKKSKEVVQEAYEAWIKLGKPPTPTESVE